MKTELANYLNGETEKLKLKQRRAFETVKFTRNQLATIYEALEQRYEFLKDFGADARNARREVMRLMDKVSNE